ncbi:MAG: 2-oxo-4-hydroxy-4-carboxy-5-ureidoimidazoline decarboxylase [Woeseiaceae bacterium]|nr:2-oxo-4-hydroxy-4-carboxy-5-ureidoimidazoline decarboxylase [Woeseiaceae bacterium]
MAHTGEDRAAFVARFGGIYEHSAWVAKAAWDRVDDPGDLAAVQAAMAACVDEADDARKLALVRAHPDLAGRAAVRGGLTRDSGSEQASAGIDQCTPAEYERFRQYNAAYRERFGFPFVMAVRGSNRHAILAAFEERLKNDADTELQRAMTEIHKIARLRLEALAESMHGNDADE